MFVRPVREDDVDAVRAIVAEWLDDGWPGEADERAELVRAALRGESSSRFFVAEVGDAVIGVIGLQQDGIDAELVLDGEHHVELTLAYVSRAHRGTGAGRALADHAESVAAAAGFTTLLVVSGARNREFGYPFWRRRYGEPCRTDPDHFGTGHERVVWRARLPR